MSEPVDARPIELTVNGTPYRRIVPTRLLLSDFLRHELELTGTHVGCEHGVCGACTILFNERSARACLMLAVQADGAALTTVEGLATTDGTLHPLQQAFSNRHGLQCGFCTPGMLMTLAELLQDTPKPSVDAIKQAISGNICRCTGYGNIVDATLEASGQLAPVERA